MYIFLLFLMQFIEISFDKKYMYTVLQLLYGRSITLQKCVAGPIRKAKYARSNSSYWRGRVNLIDNSYYTDLYY